MCFRSFYFGLNTSLKTEFYNIQPIVHSNALHLASLSYTVQDIRHSDSLVRHEKKD